MKRPTRITRPLPTRSNSAQQLPRPGRVIYTTNGFTRLSSEQDHCSPGEASCFGSLPVDHESQTELQRHSHMHSSRRCGGMMPRFVGFRTTVSHVGTAVVETHRTGKLDLGWGRIFPIPIPPRS